MAAHSKNILAVISYPFLPATTGGEISTLNILRYLALEHRVTVFTVEPYQQDLRLPPSKFKLIFGMKFRPSRYWDLTLLRKLMKMAKDEKADWFFFDQPWFGWLMLCLKIFSRRRVFIRSNNIEYLRFRSMGKWFWQMLYIYEKWTYRTADLVIFVSEADRQKAIYEFDLKPSKTMLTPYGVEATSLPSPVPDAGKSLRAQYHIGEGEKVLLFFATMSYFPNYEAVGFIATQLYPVLKQHGFRFRLLICGKNLPVHILELLRDKPELVYCGFVDDIERYIDGADVMINPILSGGGVKTKAIDTLARNQRVISTRTGAEGIDPGVCGENLVILEDSDWNVFAEAIIHYAGKPRHIQPSFYDTYGWQGIIGHLSAKLDSYAKR